MKKTPLFLLAATLLLASCGNAKEASSSTASAISSSSAAASSSSSVISSEPAPASSSTPAPSSSETPSSSSSSKEESSIPASSSSEEGSSSSSSEAKKYNVSIVKSALATLTADKKSAAEGETVTVTASLETRAILSYIKVNNETVYETESYSGVYVFTMPSQDVKITYEAKQGYLLTLEGEHATLTLDSYGVRDNVLCEDWNVIISATPEEGYHIASYSAVAESGVAVNPYINSDGQYVFSMPASNVTFSLKAEQDDPRVASWVGKYETGIGLTGGTIKKENHKLTINSDKTISFTPDGYEFSYEAKTFTINEDGTLSADTSTLADPSSLTIKKLGDGVVDLLLTYSIYSRTTSRHYILGQAGSSFMVVGSYDGESQGSYAYMRHHLACISTKSTGVFYSYYDYNTSTGYPVLQAYEDGSSTALATGLTKDKVYVLKDGTDEIAVIRYDGTSFKTASEERGTYTGEKTLFLDGFGKATLGGKQYTYTGSGSSFTLSGDEEIKVSLDLKNKTYEVVVENVNPFLGTSYSGKMQEQFEDDYGGYTTNNYTVDVTFDSDKELISSFKISSNDWMAKANKTYTDIPYSFDSKAMALTITFDTKKIVSFNVKLDYNSFSCKGSEISKFYYLEGSISSTLTLTKK